MDDDWDLEDEPVKSGSSTPAPAPVTAPAPRVGGKAKWQGEDEEEEQDDWDASEDEKPKPTTTTALPTKKKMSLKQKLAEKERLAAEGKSNGGDDDEIMDNITAQERRRQARERELEADMAVASDLMGGMGVEDGPETLKAILEAKPTSKEHFSTLSKQFMSALISRHESNPLYSAFVEQFSKDLCEGLTAVQTRKVASALSILGNTKQQEERDKASGKKKAATKPKVGLTKPTGKVDTEDYDDVLEDGDFM